MAKIFDFKANNTTPSTGALTNVVGADWTVVRNSIATIWESNLLTEVVAHIARIQDSKVLVEAQATNYFTDSDDFIQWDEAGNANLTMTKDEVGLRGNANEAVKIVSSLAQSGGYQLRRDELPINSNAVFSMFIKNIDSVNVDLRIWDRDGDDDGDWTDVTSQLNTSTFTKVHTTNNTTAVLDARMYSYVRQDVDSIIVQGMQIEEGTSPSSYIPTTTVAVTRQADVITNTVPTGTAPITMTTWIDGVSDGGVVVNQGDPITMLNGTTSIEIDDSASGATTTVEVEWIDSISAAVVGHKVYRDTVPSTGEVELADVGLGVQYYADDTALTGTEYKYEVQGYSSTFETISEQITVNVRTITTAS